MKWNTRITILYLGFVALIVTLVILAVNNPSDLVAEDYYKQELNYQKQIDKMNESKTLSEQPAVVVKTDSITLQFPSACSSKKLTGEVKFYRPSNDKDDWSTNVNADQNGKQQFPCSGLKKGLYTMQLNWSSEGKNYYNEFSVNVP